MEDYIMCSVSSTVNILYRGIVFLVTKCWPRTVYMVMDGVDGEDGVGARENISVPQAQRVRRHILYIMYTRIECGNCVLGKHSGMHYINAAMYAG